MTWDVKPARAGSRPLRLRVIPDREAVPLPCGSPYAFMALSDTLIWEYCDCPWWHRLPVVRRRVHARLP